MISKITFTGREEMLTKGLKSAAKKSYEYVGAGKVFAPKEVEAVDKKINSDKVLSHLMGDYFEPSAEQVKYVSPYAPTASHDAEKSLQVLQDNFSYAVAHGKPEGVAKEAIKSINVLI